MYSILTSGFFWKVFGESIDLTEVTCFGVEFFGKLLSVIVSCISSLRSSSLKSISFLLLASGKPLVVCLRFGLRLSWAELGLRAGCFFSTYLVLIVYGKLSTQLSSSLPSLTVTSSSGELLSSECKSPFLCSFLSCCGPSLSLYSAVTLI